MHEIGLVAEQQRRKFQLNHHAIDVDADNVDFARNAFLFDVTQGPSEHLRRKGFAFVAARILAPVQGVINPMTRFFNDQRRYLILRQVRQPCCVKIDDRLTIGPIDGKRRVSTEKIAGFADFQSHPQVAIKDIVQNRVCGVIPLGATFDRCAREGLKKSVEAIAHTKVVDDPAGRIRHGIRQPLRVLGTVALQDVEAPGLWCVWISISRRQASFSLACRGTDCAIFRRSKSRNRVAEIVNKRIGGLTIVGKLYQRIELSVAIRQSKSRRRARSVEDDPWLKYYKGRRDR